MSETVSGMKLSVRKLWDEIGNSFDMMRAHRASYIMQSGAAVERLLDYFMVDRDGQKL